LGSWLRFCALGDEADFGDENCLPLMSFMLSKKPNLNTETVFAKCLLAGHSLQLAFYLVIRSSSNLLNYMSVLVAFLNKNLPKKEAR
jgi:hypothetical protein